MNAQKFEPEITARIKTDLLRRPKNKKGRKTAEWYSHLI